MPFLKKIATSAGLIGIWKLTEDSFKLSTKIDLFEEDRIRFESFKIEKRRKEFLATRILLNILTEQKSQICYANSGRPMLEKSSKKISISHSADLAVVLLSEKEAGIDVENTDRKIERITKRFLSNAEIQQIEKSDTPQVLRIIYWSAKEAIFKCTNEEKIQFNKQIEILPFELKKEGHFQGKLKTTSKTFEFTLGYFFVENNVIVYCVELK